MTASNEIAQESLENPAPKPGRILELDALRALAAINLLLFHFTLVFPNKYGFNAPLGFELPYGKYGVQLFFMLSGFVNAMTLLRKQQPANFLAARAIRIFPSYWLAIGLNVLLLSTVSMFGTSVSPESTMANLSVMPRLFGYDTWEPVTWTLQIEILFYGLLLVLYLGGALQNSMRTLLVLLGISGFGMTLVNQLHNVQPDGMGTQLASFWRNCLFSNTCRCSWLA